MKKYLISQEGNFYKANLHCHTNLSDAIFSPEKIKEEYQKEGYSIVAYTDHDVLLGHNDLTDDSFLALNGYEMEITQGYENLEVKFGPTFRPKKTCHLCLIALEPDNLKQVCYHKNAYLFGHALEHTDKIQFDESKPDFVREHTPECINEIIREAKNSGFFVTYNHPVWSIEDYSDYSKFEGMDAMEIFNTSSYVVGYDEYNPRVYDDMLRLGKRIFCIAADDNHNGKPIGSRYCDSFGGFTMIKAEKLDYKAVTDALVRGDFYASTGPQIHELWFEDGKIHIRCTEADSISFVTGIRRAGIKFAEDENGITYAAFDVLPEDVYIRLTVTSKTGKKANTNAYFTDELFK